MNAKNVKRDTILITVNVNKLQIKIVYTKKNQTNVYTLITKKITSQ